MEKYRLIRFERTNRYCKVFSYWAWDRNIRINFHGFCFSVLVKILSAKRILEIQFPVEFSHDSLCLIVLPLTEKILGKVTLADGVALTFSVLQFHKSGEL